MLIQLIIPLHILFLLLSRETSPSALKASFSEELSGQKQIKVGGSDQKRDRGGGGYTMTLTVNMLLNFSPGNSLAIQWLGFGALTARARVQSMVRELRSYMYAVQPRKKKRKTLLGQMIVIYF